jgi:hypothetical protein
MQQTTAERPGKSLVRPNSPSKTQERSDSDALIRQWLFRFGIEHKEDVAPRLPLWLETFGAMDAALLERLFSRAFKICKFFPKVSDILEPIQGVKETAVPEAAEQAWQRVLEVRRVHWNPDIPAPFQRALAKLSERERQAARAAGVFQDFESVEALHTWAKKKFIESFARYGELERDGHLLPDGEIKNLLKRVTAPKAFPESRATWAELRERGLSYAAENRSSRAYVVDTKPRYTPPTPQMSLEEQKRALVERGFLARAESSKEAAAAR